jgi:Cof subfamily protein (haloacid dehalogenase superfamily)
MKCRLMALDLDGTMLDPLGHLPGLLAQRLRDLSESGVRIVIATGRMPEAALHFGHSATDDPSVAAYNGSVLVIGGKTERVGTVKASTVAKVADYCKMHGYYCDGYSNGTIVASAHRRELDTDVDLPFAKWRVADLSLAPIDTPKMVVMDGYRDVSNIVDEMCQLFPELFITQSTDCIVEVMPKGVDKGTGVKAIAERLGIAREDVVAVGDGMNDLPMLEWAGKGVAVGNADQRLKKAASIVTGGSGPDGVIELIDSFSY